MGQYYRPIVLKPNWKQDEQPIVGALSPYDFDNGAKLMEHSYVHNKLVEKACMMIDLLGNHKAVPFVWCGDYADPVSTDIYPTKQSEENPNEIEGGYQPYDRSCDFIGKDREAEPYRELKEKLEYSDTKTFRYAINETKRQFVKVPDFDKDKWTLHPLPLLCAAGNGRGGGDYHGGKNDKLIGSWAYDEIRVTNTKADTEGYEDCGWVVEWEK